MRKLPDWQTRLSVLVIEAHKSARFEWGRMDCCMWAAAAYEAQIGEDLASDLRGTYSDAAAAAKVLRARGGLRGVGSLAGPEVHKFSAQHGDIGIVRGLNGKPVLGVFNGTLWMIVTAAGLAVLPITAAIKCWRVGYA